MRRRRNQDGFSLLEVMVALAILAAALVILLNIVTSNVRATNHAKLTTAATFLARSKMIDVEDQILEEGFIDNDREESGDFADQEMKEFRWTTLIERIELPTDIAQMAQTAQGEAQASADSSDPLSAMTGLMGGFMTTLIEPIRIGLQESVRRVTVKVAWDEIGRGEQTVEVVTYLTDPAKLDLAVQAPAGEAGGTGASGSGTGGTSGSGRAPTGGSGNTIRRGGGTQ